MHDNDQDHRGSDMLKMISDVVTTHAPQAIGPYSQAIRIPGMMWTSGQIGMVPGTTELVNGGIEAQTRQALSNLKAVLIKGGSDMRHVVKTTCFLKNMSDFQTMNTIYAEFFTQPPMPARSTVEVARLPKEALFEIEATAVTSHDTPV
jgi:2-iminobutanoate/2-iminopropanoate deaminase